MRRRIASVLSHLHGRGTRPKCAAFAAPLGRAIAPIIQQADDVVRVGYSQVANAGNRRLQNEIGRNLERYVPASEIRRKFPTLGRGESPRFRQQNAKDKLIGLIRKVRKRSGKIYYSKPQRAEMATNSAMDGAQKYIKSIADNYKGKF